MDNMIDPSEAGWKPFTQAGFVGLVGPLWTRREAASWTYGLVVEDRHLNESRTLHGGMLTTLVDEALSLIVWEAIERRPCATIQLDMQFVGAVRAGAFIEVRGRVTRQTTSLVFMQGAATVDGAEIGTAIGMWKILRTRE
jgi:acyl-coenzyme A thioesterase PaaI-like protein